MNKYLPFQIPASLQKFTSLASGGMKFELMTQENVSPEDLTKVMRLLNKVGWFSFNVDQLETQDIVKLIDIKIDKSKYADGKTPSQRLRSSLFILHQQNGGKKEDFSKFYDEHMEKIIQFVKEKLE